MNKTNIPQTPHLSVECVRRTRLGDFWNGISLGGPSWRLYRMEQSGAAISSEGKKVVLSPERIYLIPPAFSALRTVCHGEPVQLYIHFTLSIPYGNRRWIFPLEQTALLRSLADTLKDALETDPLALKPGTNLLAASLAAAGAAMLPPEEGLPRQDVRIADACEQMRQNPEYPWSIDELAEKAGMAPNAFLRSFRLHTGIPPYRYLLQLRYSLAARMLETGDQPIDGICAAVGVADRFHFSRLFRRFYGVSPARYRKERSGREMQEV